MDHDGSRNLPQHVDTVLGDATIRQAVLPKSDTARLQQPASSLKTIWTKPINIQALDGIKNTVRR